MGAERNKKSITNVTYMDGNRRKGRPKNREVQVFRSER